jgi:hypothetical protein
VRVIALDTNQIAESLNLRSATLSMLQHVARTANYRLAVPQVVLEEVLARYDRLLLKRHGDAEKARSFLAALAETAVTPGPLLDLASERAARRRQMTEVFDLLVTPPGAAEEGLRREAWRLAPCKSIGQDQVGTGARDTAIWLTIRDLANDATEPVYFVSANTKDFGKDGLRPELAAELDDPSRLVYLNDLAELLDEFGTTQPDVDVAALGADDTVKTVIRLGLTHEFDGPRLLRLVNDIPKYGFFRRTDGAQDVEIAPGRRDQQAYLLGDTLYVVLTTPWSSTHVIELVGDAQLYELKITMRNEVTILLQLDESKGVALASFLAAGPATDFDSALAYIPEQVGDAVGELKSVPLRAHAVELAVAGSRRQEARGRISLISEKALAKASQVLTLLRARTAADYTGGEDIVFKLDSDSVEVQARDAGHDELSQLMRIATQTVRELELGAGDVEVTGTLTDM